MMTPDQDPWNFRIRIGALIVIGIFILLMILA